MRGGFGGQMRDSLKLVVAGAFGVGKTTLITSVSEYTPLSTETPMTQASVGIDSVAGVEDKTRTTVAMDFGRIRLGTEDSSTVLYLFGTPGQIRFFSILPTLANGAIGALILVDVRRFAESFAVVDAIENEKLPYVIGLNQFPGVTRHTPEQIREALSIPDSTPVLECNALQRRSSLDALIAVTEHALVLTPEDGGMLS